MAKEKAYHVHYIENEDGTKTKVQLWPYKERYIAMKDYECGFGEPHLIKKGSFYIRVRRKYGDHEPDDFRSCMECWPEDKK